MLSRTSARQQRMRQQTLNEERMAQNQIEQRTSSERRSSGSKLIISSPTTTCHPSLNLNLPNSQLPNSHTDSNLKLGTQYNRGFGPSVLLASLSGTNQTSISTALSPISSSNISESAPQSRFYNSPNNSPQTLSNLSDSTTQQQQLQQTQQGCSGFEISRSSLGRTNNPNVYNSYDPNRNSSTPLNVLSNKPSNQSPSSNQPSQRGLSFNHSQSNQTKQSGSGDSTSPLTRITSNSELSGLEMESNDSPTPPDMNSPMESCFANIMEDQGSDSFDLNNITPSIHLSSSVGVSGSAVEYSHHTPDSVSRINCTNVVNVPESGIQISPVDINTHIRRSSGKHGRDEESGHASSCPAGMPEGFQPRSDGTSPLQPVSRASQSVAGGNENSPAVVNATDAASLPVSHGSLAVINVPSTNRTVDDQRVAWMRDRTKKDSHNRIERKRRDYINCQIAELGSLLPEDMFRDGSDGKKNKGSILKNSVEFICLLRSELAQVPEVLKETNLAAKVIGQLVKRIQELEANNNTSNNQSQQNRLNSDYQNLLQEWILLHENNIQNTIPFVTASPITRHIYHPNTDTAGSSSPGLSSVCTDDLMSGDTKTIFSASVPTAIVGSAPAPSNPLTNCSRLSSPLSTVAIVSKPTGAIDSPLRLMRTRCTSLSVSTTGTSNLNEVNVPSVKLHTTDLQAHSNRVRGQRGLQSHPSPQLRILQSVSHPNQSSQSQLRTSVLQSRPVQQVYPAQTTLSSQNQQFNMQRHGQLSRGVGSTLNPPPNQELLNTGCLSVSLPVNVNPLLCGAQDREVCDMSDDKISQIYPFESNTFLSHLKSEPHSELLDCKINNDGNYSIHNLGLDLSHVDVTNTILEPVTNFDPLIASVVHNQNHHHHHQQQQSFHILNNSRSRMYDTITSMNLDSSSPPPPTSSSAAVTVPASVPGHVGLDVDDFQFDDVPME